MAVWTRPRRELDGKSGRNDSTLSMISTGSERKGLSELRPGSGDGEAEGEGAGVELSLGVGEGSRILRRFTRASSSSSELILKGQRRARDE